jgi:Rrf2 family iron-sulfur cluster assembly transcriptional regulator
MLLSQTCRYGLRAVLYIASVTEEPGDSVSIRKISNDLGISFHFLTKILQQLTQSGLLQSFRGAGGGVALARPLKELTLLDIVEIIEGPELLHSCVLGLDKCNSENPCPLHDQWAKSRKHLEGVFASSNLEQLALRIKTADLRLGN